MTNSNFTHCIIAQDTIDKETLNDYTRLIKVWVEAISKRLFQLQFLQSNTGHFMEKSFNKLKETMKNKLSPIRVILI